MGVRGLRGVEGFSLGNPADEAKEDAAVDAAGADFAAAAPRGGASGRSPCSISARRAAASRLMIRNLPSMESYVAPVGRLMNYAANGGLERVGKSSKKTKVERQSGTKELRRG